MKIREMWFDLRWWWEDRPQWLFPERVKVFPESERLSGDEAQRMYRDEMIAGFDARQSLLRKSVTPK